MGCCSSKQEQVVKCSEIYAKNDKRGCTNLICCFIFLICWVAFIAILAVGIVMGNSDGIFYGTDYTGEYCTAKNDSDSHGKYIYYPQLSQDIMYSIAKTGKDALDSGPLQIPDITMNLYGICVNECPKMGAIICNYGNDTCKGCVSDIKIQDNCSTACLNQCWSVPLHTKSYFYRCLFDLTETSASSTICANPKMTGPTLSPTDPKCISQEVTTVKKKLELTFKDPLSDTLMTYSALMSSWMSDIIGSWLVILICGVAIPVVFGFLFVLMIKYVISCFIYVVYILIVLLGIFLCIFCFMKAGYFQVDDITSMEILSKINNTIGNALDIEIYSNNSFTNSSIASIFAYDEQYDTYWKVGAWCSLVLVLLCFLFIIFTWSAIQVVVGVIKESSNALFRMPCIIFLPFISIIETGLVVAFFIFSSAYLTTVSTSSEIDIIEIPDKFCSESSFCSYTPPKVSVNSFGFYFIWVNLLGFLWTNEFINGIFLMIIACSIAQWYFTPIDENKNKDIGSPICNSIYTVHRYHLGSIVAGSLIISLVKLVRYILFYLKARFINSDSYLAKCILCCLQCCLWCFEKCLKFITRNAYILIAIKGCGFWGAAKESFGLIFSNPSRFALLNTTTYVILFIGKIVISLIGGVCAYLVLSGFSYFNVFSGIFNVDVGNIFVPAGVSLIVSFYVAMEFLAIYSMIIDSILVCFLLDEQATKSIGSSDCMPEKLREAIGVAQSKDYKPPKEGSDKTEVNVPSDTNNPPDTSNLPPS